MDEIHRLEPRKYEQAVQRFVTNWKSQGFCIAGFSKDEYFMEDTIEWLAS